MNKIPSGVRAQRARSYADLEAIACTVRLQLQYAADRPITGLRFFDEINSVQITVSDGSVCPLETGVECLGDGREGLSRYNADGRKFEILLAPETYDGLERDNPRSTYCLVHEFSHVVLHADQLRELAELPRQSQIAFHRGTLRPHPMYLDTEWQANALAAALLMPARGLLGLKQTYGLLTPALVTSRYGVSSRAAEIRVDIFTNKKDELLRRC